jgi:hypothetical protein
VHSDQLDHPTEADVKKMASPAGATMVEAPAEKTSTVASRPST